MGCSSSIPSIDLSCCSGGYRSNKERKIVAVVANCKRDFDDYIMTKPITDERHPYRYIFVGNMNQARGFAPNMVEDITYFDPRMSTDHLRSLDAARTIIKSRIVY